MFALELDALQLEEEEEGPSYLADLNKAPDFIDEPPVEIAEVNSNRICCSDGNHSSVRHLRKRL